MEILYTAAIAGGIIKFDMPTLWTAIGLVLFLALCAYLGAFKAMASGLDKRAETIRNELDEARQLREEAQALMAEYQRKRKDAENDAQEIVEAAKREADAISIEAKEKTAEFVARRTAMAETKIAQAEADAVNAVKSTAVEKAVDAAAKLIAEKAKGKTASELVAQSIEDVKTRLN